MVPTGPPPSSGTGVLSKLYNNIIGTVDKFVPSKLRPLWQHPAGPKTIFFWGPLFKWGLVFAGLGDLKRPADKLSTKQCGILAITGFIWSRWALVIIPKNYSFLAVNFFMALTQCYQFSRAISYELEQRKLKS